MVESHEGRPEQRNGPRKGSKTWILFLIILILAGIGVLAFTEYRVSALERELVEFRSTVEEERAEQERLRSRVSGLVDNSEQLQYDLSTKDEEVGQLIKEMLARYDSEIAASRELINELQSSFSRLGTAIESLNERQNRMRDALASLSGDIRSEVAGNRDFLKNLNSSVETLEAEVSRRFGEVQDVQASLQEMEDTLAKMRENGATVDAVRRDLESEIQKTTTTLDGINARLDDLRVELERLRREATRVQF